MYKKLIDLRAELHVPKNQYNKFGGFYYRSQEDILEGVKPVLKKYGLLLVISDDLKNIGDRYYVEATAKIVDDSGKTVAESKAFAREPEHKKGMDEPQISGTASSYARKYALNALFLLDDVKGADTDEYQETANKGSFRNNTPKKRKNAEMTPSATDESTFQRIVKIANTSSIPIKDKAKIMAAARSCGGNEEQLKTVLKNINLEYKEFING